MTSAGALLTDGFDRVRDAALAVLDGLDDEQLRRRPAPGVNPVGWLVWHLTRVQDDHVAGVAGTAQVWTGAGWDGRIDSGHPTGSIGYGDDDTAVDRVRTGAAELAGYHRAVHDRTVAFLAGLTDDDLARVVDQRWDPPVTMAVRLVSVLDDDLQHAGQAAYVRGLLERS